MNCKLALDYLYQTAVVEPTVADDMAEAAVATIKAHVNELEMLLQLKEDGLMEEDDVVVKDIAKETIEKLQGLLREGDRLTITPKSARLVQWGYLTALGTLTVASFLVREG